MKRSANPGSSPADVTSEVATSFRQKGPMTARSTLGVLAIAVLAGIYSFAQPRLNDQFGWDLPSLREVPADNPPTATSTGSKDPTAATLDNRKPQSTSATKDDTGDSEQLGSTEPELLYGLLRETSPQNYLSPAGLQYTPGSAEGHRLEHLRRHTKDAPSRPGKHGVFDGEMEDALRTIDKAYERAKSGTRTTKTTDQGRTIYTVDMGSRVGFVGGRDGARKRNPMARRVRIVLEGTRVITAYPL